jgi:hypothetical protein
MTPSRHYVSRALLGARCSEGVLRAGAQEMELGIGDYKRNAGRLGLGSASR